MSDDKVIHLDKDLGNTLKEEARKRGISLAAMVRVILYDYMQKEERKEKLNG